jgi:hypothetical protein
MSASLAFLRKKSKADYSVAVEFKSLDILEIFRAAVLG